MKHTFPLVLNARVSGVMHRVWKMAVWATLLMDRLHSRHTAHASCSLRPRSRRERMSARDTFSCQDRLRLRQVWGQARAQQALLPGKGLAPWRLHGFSGSRQRAAGFHFTSETGLWAKPLEKSHPRSHPPHCPLDARGHRAFGRTTGVFLGDMFTPGAGT